MRSCTQTAEGEVALRADSYTPRFAFTLHLKLIPFLCVCACMCACARVGWEACQIPGRPPFFLPEKAKGKKALLGGKGKVSVSGNVDRTAIKIPFSMSFWWNSQRSGLKAGLITHRPSSLRNLRPSFPRSFPPPSPFFLYKCVSFPH